MAADASVAFRTRGGSTGELYWQAGEIRKRFNLGGMLLKLLGQDLYDVIILNFANCDMVGHTGVETAAIKAVEAVDACAGRVVDRILELGGAVLITADHGNAEQMQDENGEPFTAHTTNPVPFLTASVI